MRKYLVGLLWLVVVLLPRPVLAENINRFLSQIEIEKAGTIQIEETIVYDFGGQSRHGIFRTIPYLKTNNQGKQFQLKINDIEVRLNDQGTVPYQESRANGELTLKIGDPDRYVSGEQTYTLKYTVAGALTYFTDHDELYWNITGNDWQIPILESATTISLPQAVGETEVRFACYTGVKGSTAKNCDYRSSTPNSYSFDTTIPLGSREGLTVVLGFPKGIVNQLEPAPYTPFWQTTFGRILAWLFRIVLAAVLFFWYLAYPVIIAYRWFKEGRDPVGKVGETQAWFAAPKVGQHSLTPAEVGVAVDERVEVRDILAMVIDLARRGYFKIEERKKNDFYFLKQKDYQADSDLLPFEKRLLTGLFGSKDEVRIKDKQLYTIFTEITKELYQRVVDLGLFAKNPNSIRIFYGIILALAVFSFNFLLALSAAIFGLQMPQKTVLGAETAAVGRSLRNFLVSQERSLAFQAKEQLWFEKLLPFAIAFGVEKVWAQRFAKLALKAPDWFSSYNQRPFTTSLLINDLGRSLTSVRSSMSPPSSSSRGLSSGFSAGSSGGGGGGGGGGSW